MTSPLLSEIAALKSRLAHLESQLPSSSSNDSSSSSAALTPPEYLHYSRQLILPAIGLPGQLTLKRTRTLLIGLGGLGSPCALYLAGAGIGTLGLCDHDTVESSNLHRQILHTTSSIGTSKVASAVNSLKDRNPHVRYIPHEEPLCPENVFRIFEGYDLIVDCTDHPALRHLISDAAVVLGKPVVSASALRMEGQLLVLNHPVGQGPCYRCVWPIPPREEDVTSCGDGGILGPVVGAMGVMQAIEVLRVLLEPPKQRQHRMLLFSAWSEQQWRSVRIKGKRENCPACGNAPTISRETIADGGREYAQLCGSSSPSSSRPFERRLSIATARARLNEHPLLIDTRDSTQFGITNIPGSINIPFTTWERAAPGIPEEARRLLDGEGEKPVWVVCRLGNDSQVAARRIVESGVVEDGRVWDVAGGIRAWAREAPAEDGVVEY